MRLRVNTASGSMYILDSEEMTWERVNDEKPIRFYEGHDKGHLALWPTVTAGWGMQFTDVNPSEEFSVPIWTTQVVRIELI